MRYRELIIEINKDDVQAAVDELAAIDITSLMIDDPRDAETIREHPEAFKYDYLSEEIEKDRREKARITAYFDCDEEGLEKLSEAEEAIRTLQSSLGDDALLYYDHITDDDSSWLYKWQEHFKPTKVGECFVVKPSWEDYDAKDGEMVIEMDPGMAFGSGLHETTTLCIRALEKILRFAQDDRNSAQDDRKARVLDIGCGTGILSIAAAMLGAEHCLGVDIDPDAVEIAKSNIERNGLSGRIDAAWGDLTQGIDFKADIIVANLMADLVMKLAASAADHLEPGGIFISSGILDVKEEPVSEAIRAAGFEISEVIYDGEWCAVVAIKGRQ